MYPRTLSPTLKRPFVFSPIIRKNFTNSTSISLSYDLYEPKSSSTELQQSTPLLILHGLFGSKQNWRSLSKAFAQKLNTRVFPLDLRNHGDSPHQSDMSYAAMANDVAEFIKVNNLGKVNLMGHSMGGRVAMHLALNNLVQLHKLIVVDVAPVKIDLMGSFADYVSFMKQLHQKGFSSHKDANDFLKPLVHDPSVRRFLLTNYKKHNSRDSYFVRVNLDSIGKYLDELGALPRSDLSLTSAIPTLFIAGSQSNYIEPSSHPAIKQLFTNCTIETLQAGHWVHAEKPLEFLDLVLTFLSKQNKQ